MSNERFNDFDDWEAEHTGEPIRFKLLGEEWELPGSIDATKILRMQRLESAVARLAAGEDEEKIAAEFADQLADLSYEALARTLVGDMLDRWLAKGIKLDKLQAVTRWLYAIYTGQDPDAALAGGEAAGKPQGSVKQPTDHQPKRQKRKTSSVSS